MGVCWAIALVAALLAVSQGQQPQDVECFPCHAGFQGNGNRPNCSSCAAGECTLPMNCSVCAAGHYSESQRSSTCSRCTVGTFSPGPGAVMCTPAPPGYTSAPPFVKAEACPAGSFESERHCLPCAGGQFSPLASTQCFVCPAGTYGATPPDAGCVPCPQGTSNALTGQAGPDACVAVAAGSFALAGSAMPSQCPSSYKCDGQSLPQPCLPFFDSVAGATSCDATPWLYVFVPAAAVTGLLLAAVVWLFVSGFFGKRPPVKVAPDEETQRLLTEEKPIAYTGL
jgi:hypothetical protein